MAMGLPIVASLRGESADILNASKAALVCEPEDVASIKKNILMLFGAKALKEDMGNQGRSFVEHNYDRKVLSGQYINFIEKILDKSVHR